MNGRERQKSNYELDCLNTAISLGQDKIGSVGDFFRIIKSGQIIERDKPERPDIILECHNPKTEKRIFIGIEQFSVDQTSIRKSNKMISQRDKDYSHLKKIYESGHTKVINGEDPSEEDMKNMLLGSFKLAGNILSSSYDSLIESLEYNFCQHLSSSNDYWNELKQISENEQSILCFLIQVKCSNSNLFLNSNGRIEDLTHGILPITADVIEILKSVPKNQVSCFILLYENFADPSKKEVYVFNNGDYAYGENLDEFVPFVYLGTPEIVSIKISDDVIKTDTEHTVYCSFIPKGEDKIVPDIFSAYKKAYYAKVNKVPFVTTRQIQSLLYALGNNVSFNENEKGEIVVKSSLSKSEVMQRFDKFVSFFPL